MIVSYFKFKGKKIQPDYEPEKDLKDFGKFALQLSCWHTRERIKEMMCKINDLIGGKKIINKEKNKTDQAKDRVARDVDITVFEKRIKLRKMSKVDFSPLKNILKMIVQYALSTYERFIGAKVIAEPIVSSRPNTAQKENYLLRERRNSAEKIQGPRVGMSNPFGINLIYQAEDDIIPESPPQHENSQPQTIPTIPHLDIPAFHITPSSMHEAPMSYTSRIDESVCTNLPDGFHRSKQFAV